MSEALRKEAKDWADGMLVEQFADAVTNAERLKNVGIFVYQHETDAQERAEDLKRVLLDRLRERNQRIDELIDSSPDDD